MKLREFLKDIADVIREGFGFSADNLVFKPKDFPQKIRDAYAFRYDVGYDDGYSNGDASGYYDGYEEGYGNGWKEGSLDASPQETVSGEAVMMICASDIVKDVSVKVSGAEKLYKQGKNLFNNNTSLIEQVSYTTSAGNSASKYQTISLQEPDW